MLLNIFISSRFIDIAVQWVPKIKWFQDFIPFFFIPERSQSNAPWKAKPANLFQQSVFWINSRNCSPSTISVMIFETLADIWPPSLSMLIFRRYIGIDLSGYPSDSSGHQTLRRRPPQRAKKKQKLSGKSLEWPKVKQTCLTPWQPSLPSGEHSGFALGWDGLYTMHEVPSRTETKARLPQKKLTVRDSFG